MSKMEEFNCKNRIYYFFDGMINIKNFDPNQIKMDTESYKNIIIYYIGYITTKNLNYVKTNSVNPLYLVTDKVGGCIEGSNGNKNLTLVFNNKIEDLIR